MMNWLSGQDYTKLLVSLGEICDFSTLLLFAQIHGRYRTIGFADVRAIPHYLIPVFSGNCRSSDSEAMNSKQKGYDLDDLILL